MKCLLLVLDFFKIPPPPTSSPKNTVLLLLVNVGLPYKKKSKALPHKSLQAVSLELSFYKFSTLAAQTADQTVVPEHCGSSFICSRSGVAVGWLEMEASRA